MSGVNDSAAIVSDYNMHTMLRKIGYSFDANELDIFRANCFSVIAEEIADISREDMKRSRSR